MQRTTHGSSTYRKAAAAGMQMENHWTNPELSSQPHASEMHAGAADARRSRPAVAFPDVSVAFTSEASPPNRAFDTIHCGGPHSVTHGFDHPSYGGLQAYHPATDLMCRYPKCFAIFPTQWQLDQHSEVHLATPLPVPSFVTNIGFNGSITMPTHQSDHELAMNGLMPEPHMFGNNLYSHAVQDPWSYPAMATPGAPTNATFMHRPHTYNDTSPQNLGNPNPGGLPLPPTSLAPSTTPSTPSGTENRYACSFPGCTTSCARPGDLRRHARKHVTGPKLDCPTPGCPRKGVRGFDRGDKMRSHHAVCSRRVRSGYAPA
ncbi:hypothetical protein XANCAGTX0491_005806 [Xanthoria calcicola]